MNGGTRILYTGNTAVTPWRCPNESSPLRLFQYTPLTTFCFPSASGPAATSRSWSDRRKNGPHQRQTRRAGWDQRSPPGDVFLCISVFAPPFSSTYKLLEALTFACGLFVTLPPFMGHGHGGCVVEWVVTWVGGLVFVERV